jgi:hypothetical protein
MFHEITHAIRQVHSSDVAHNEQVVVWLIYDFGSTAHARWEMQFTDSTT